MGQSGKPMPCLPPMTGNGKNVAGGLFAPGSHQLDLSTWLRCLWDKRTQRENHGPQVEGKPDHQSSNPLKPQFSWFPHSDRCSPQESP